MIAIYGKLSLNAFIFLFFSMNSHLDCYTDIIKPRLHYLMGKDWAFISVEIYQLQYLNIFDPKMII